LKRYILRNHDAYTCFKEGSFTSMLEELKSWNKVEAIFFFLKLWVGRNNLAIKIFKAEQKTWLCAQSNSMLYGWRSVALVWTQGLSDCAVVESMLSLAL
jgi:hypothetical protein